MVVLDKKTRRAVRLLRAGTLAGMGLVAVTLLFAVTVFIVGEGWFDPRILGLGDDGLAPRPAAALLFLTGALLLIALMRLLRLPRAIERGMLFATRPLRGFALFLFLAVSATVLGPPLIQGGMVLAAGGGAITLSLDGGQLLMLFVTGLLFLVARLLDAAQSMADEMSQIV